MSNGMIPELLTNLFWIRIRTTITRNIHMHAHPQIFFRKPVYIHYPIFFQDGCQYNDTLGSGNSLGEKTWRVFLTFLKLDAGGHVCAF